MVAVCPGDVVLVYSEGDAPVAMVRVRGRDSVQESSHNQCRWNRYEFATIEILAIQC